MRYDGEGGEAFTSDVAELRAVIKDHHWLVSFIWQSHTTRPGFGSLPVRSSGCASSLGPHPACDSHVSATLSSRKHIASDLWQSVTDHDEAMVYESPQH